MTFLFMSFSPENKSVKISVFFAFRTKATKVP